ncbi:hypothetical protein KY311_01510 [Candidatus Woesearchaeota archaeon]|nr:hypothetical protein [Candidatus Woesearchaeota archaeon]MBW3017255.1 hypothetical protein [Candidatus Woesearchaeota archaeon]
MFQQIKTPTNGKSYKLKNRQLQCAECGQKIDLNEDHFKLNLHWKIKKNADEKYFCRLDCIKAWCKD